MYSDITEIRSQKIGRSMGESSDQLSIDRPILRIVAQKVYFNMNSLNMIFHLWRSFGKIG